jgi:hypothetical protein
VKVPLEPRAVDDDEGVVGHAEALTGGYVWLWGGLAATGCAAGLLSALALGSLVWGLRGWHPRPL